MKCNIDVYYPKYKRLEAEVLELSYLIAFTDEQLKVYSPHIADLIIRCANEIESIAKDIYRRDNSGDNNVTASESIVWIETVWEISKKVLVLYSPNMMFEKYVALAPFDYKNNSKQDYYSTYCAIKHDRVKNLYKANIETLLRTLGALFILNLIYKDDAINLGDSCYEYESIMIKYSDIFKFVVAPYPKEPLMTSQMGIDSKTCLYKVVKPPKEYCYGVSFFNHNNETRKVKIIIGSRAFQIMAESDKGRIIEENEFWSRIGGKEAFYKLNNVSKVLSIVAEEMGVNYKAVVNRTQLP